MLTTAFNDSPCAGELVRVPRAAFTLSSSGAIAYTLISWSDGGAATHTVVTPATNTTDTALYSTPPSIPTGLQVVR